MSGDDRRMGYWALSGTREMRRNDGGWTKKWGETVQKEVIGKEREASKVVFALQ